MTIRKIQGTEEYKRTLEVFAIAFEAEASRQSTSGEEVARVLRQPANREERYWQERWAAFDPQGDMMGFLIGFPATVRFDGHEAVCTCIGGVSSLPQHRGQGVIAGCFRRHLEDSYQSGAVFSYLYPFSTVFYRQFGYEVCAETVEWSFDTATIPAFPEARGQAVLNENGSVQAEIGEVYRSFAARYNMSFVREECDWGQAISQHPAYDHHYTYLWRNRDGQPKGFLTYRKEYDEQAGQSVMICRSFCYADEEGLRGLLGFIRSFRSHMQRVQLSLPRDAALERALPEVSGRCKREVRFTGMGRIINVRQALELARYQGSGSIALQVSDPCVEENNRVFRVTFRDGRCEQVEEGDTPELALGVGELSRLLLGACGPFEMTDSRLRQVFFPKPLFICDFF